MSASYVNYRIDCCHEDNTRDFSKTEELFNYCMKTYEWFHEQSGDYGFFYKDGSILSTDCNVFVTDDMDENYQWLIDASKAINAEKIIADAWFDGSEYDWSCNEYYAVIIHNGEIQDYRRFSDVNSKNMLCCEDELSGFYPFLTVLSRDTYDYCKGLFKNKFTGEVVKLGQLLIDKKGNPSFNKICEL